MPKKLSKKERENRQNRLSHFIQEMQRLQCETGYELRAQLDQDISSLKARIHFVATREGSLEECQQAYKKELQKKDEADS